MNKIISIILLCCLLLTSLSSCSYVDKLFGNEDKEPEEKLPVIPEEPDSEVSDTNAPNTSTMELYDVFEIIRADAEAEVKLGFSIEYEEIYYELKNSGQYDNCEWKKSDIVVTVDCNYDCAVDQDWYKQCSTADIEVLNQAFYNCYSSFVSNGKYSNIFFSPCMHLTYLSIDEFYNDYAFIKTLVNLEYVTQVYIVYYFGLPRDYRIE